MRAPFRAASNRLRASAGLNSSDDLVLSLITLGVSMTDYKDKLRYTTLPNIKTTSGCTSRTLAEGLGTNASFVRKLLIPLTREGMIVVAIGKGGGLHLGRAAEQITLRDLYLAVMGDKRILVAREDIPSRCSISANINEFFTPVSGLRQATSATDRRLGTAPAESVPSLASSLE